MEIVLLWLDELDDLVFVGLAMRPRRLILAASLVLAAAIGLGSLTWLGMA